MYTVAVRQDFVARHFLLALDAGSENQLHSHNYTIEVQLEGKRLDENGYLCDITEIKSVMETLLARYREQTLNDAPEFAGLNPSVEHFARIFCHSLAEAIQAPNLSAITIRLWEDENAWAAYRQER
ncbi:MAG TPA: 6-carboxytetrahydropterin synthase [Pyrinomonadaceae bacterium]|jgi:6-pyruvoyltetrahydropterin/6-carboxytetrahydropterin synthase